VTISRSLMSPQSSRNASLDALRVVSFLGIVALHVAGGGFTGNKPIGFVVDEMSRFAVPVFFLLSAYFWREEDLAAPLRLTWKLARRVIPAFAVVLAVTVALRLIEGSHLRLELSPGGVLHLVWTGGPAFHLWFLPALVLGGAIVVVLMKYLGLRWTMAIAFFLYATGTVLGAYSPTLLGLRFPFWFDRNGLFFAPVFLVGGIFLRRHRAMLENLPVTAIALAATILAALHLAEGYFVVGRYPMGHDFSIATLGYAFAVAILFMRLDLRSPIWSILGQATFGAYLIHLIVLHTLATYLKLGASSWMMIALVFTVSLGLSMAFRAGRSRLAEAVARA